MLPPAIAALAVGGIARRNSLPAACQTTPRKRATRDLKRSKELAPHLDAAETLLERLVTSDRIAIKTAGLPDLAKIHHDHMPGLVATALTNRLSAEDGPKRVVTVLIEAIARCYIEDDEFQDRIAEQRAVLNQQEHGRTQALLERLNQSAQAISARESGVSEVALIRLASKIARMFRTRKPR